MLLLLDTKVTVGMIHKARLHTRRYALLVAVFPEECSLVCMRQTRPAHADDRGIPDDITRSNIVLAEDEGAISERKPEVLQMRASQHYFIKHISVPSVGTDQRNS